MAKYLLNIRNHEDGLNYNLEYKTLEEARNVLREKLNWCSENGCKIEKIDEYKYLSSDPYELSITTYSIEKDDKKSNNNNQQLTLKFNNQTKTTMPTKRSSSAKTDKNGRVVGNPYQTKVAGKAYMKVPERMVTLPAGNHFITARKHQVLNSTYKDKSGKIQHNIAVYVMGYSNLKGKTQNGKTRRHWFVARQFNVGGMPKLSLFRYSGYDRATARRVFMEIPCSEAWWLKRTRHQSGQWEESWVKGKAISASEIVAAKVAARQRAQANIGYNSNGATLR